MNMNLERRSGIELLRLVSMLFIVYYHMLVYLTNEVPESGIVKVLWPFFHIGVICFVLISGYFGIHSGKKGLAKLIGICLVYSIPNIVYKCVLATSPQEYLQAFMFLSKSDYWFIRTYLALFLLAPLVNRFNDHCSGKEQWILMSVLGVLSVYVGCIAKDPIYLDGKNLIHFIFVYQLGHTFRQHESVIREKWGINKLLIAFAAISILETAVLFLAWDSYLGHLVWRMTFAYNSPVLLANASLFFLIFAQMEFSSAWVNKLAKGCLAVYLIHGITPVILHVERPMVKEIYGLSGSLPKTVVILFGVSILIMTLCLFINYLLTPVFRVLSCWETSLLERKGKVECLA